MSFSLPLPSGDGAPDEFDSCPRPRALLLQQTAQTGASPAGTRARRPRGHRPVFSESGPIRPRLPVQCGPDAAEARGPGRRWPRATVDGPPGGAGGLARRHGVSRVARWRGGMRGGGAGGGRGSWLAGLARGSLVAAGSRGGQRRTPQSAIAGGPERTPCAHRLRPRPGVLGGPAEGQPR